MARDPYGDHHLTNTWPTYLTVIKHIILITVDSWCDLFSTWALIRGRDYRQINIHSAEVSTLYPHYETHGLALPFGWTNGVPTKLIYCHDTLPALLTQTPPG